MPSTREVLPNEPIAIVTVFGDFDFKTEGVAGMQESVKFLDSLDEPVHFISDFSAIEIDFAMMMQGSNLASRGKNPLLHHPKVRSISYVTQSSLMDLAAKGMNSEAFGNLNIMVFETLDEALAKVRALA